MSIRLLFLCVIAGLLFSSCEITVNEGSSSTEENSSDSEIKNGFSYEEIEMSMNGIVDVKNNEVIGGEYLIIEFKGIENATLKDGFQHVGLSIEILGPDGELLDGSEDLMSNVEQQDPDLSDYHFYYAIPRSFAGKEMIFNYSLFDKYGEVSYDFSEVFTVTAVTPPVTKNIEIEKSFEGSVYPQILIGEFQKASCPFGVSNPFKIDLYLSQVSGFEVTESGVMNITYKMDVMDEKGEVFISTEDEGEVEVDEEGYLYMSYYLESEEIEPGNYDWVITMKINGGKDEMKVSAPFIIL